MPKQVSATVLSQSRPIIINNVSAFVTAQIINYAVVKINNNLSLVAYYYDKR